MALRFRELPWVIQALIYALLAAAIFVGGWTLDFSPVKQERDNVEQLKGQLSQLNQQVARLQAVEQQHQEFLTRLQALEEQLARSHAFVPEEKQTDEFMRVLLGASGGSQISVRRLASRAVVMREFYAEMPFLVQLDGAYYDLMEFFKRLGGTARIINASGLQLGSLEKGRGQYDYRPGSTVDGAVTVTTYYTPSEAELAAAAPPAPGAPAPPRQ